jgi:hypothetical protein
MFYSSFSAVKSPFSASSAPSFLLNGTPSSPGQPRGPVDAHTRLIKLQGEAAGDVLRAAEGSLQQDAHAVAQVSNVRQIDA